MTGRRRHEWVNVPLMAITVSIMLGLPAGCSEGKKAEATGEVIRGEELKIYGALRSIFRDGDTSEVVKLEAVLPDTNIFGIGAISGLRGEITIIDGTAYLSYPDGADAVRTDSTRFPDEGATLLLCTEVSTWHAVEISADIVFDDLEDRLASIAASVGVNPEYPFSFLVRGRFTSVQWHVIDGRRLKEGGASHGDHLSASVRQNREEARGTLFGFYSPLHHGVISHMGSKTHIHCVIDGPLSSGHVDNVVLPAGTVIHISGNLHEPQAGVGAGVSSMTLREPGLTLTAKKI